MFDQVSTGAVDDLSKATDIARNMVMRYGMDETLGPITYMPDRPLFLGQTPILENHTRDYRAPLRIRDLTEDDWLNGLWPSAAMLAPGFPGVFRAPIELFPLQDRAQAISYPEYCHTAAARRFSWSRRRML